MPHTVTLAVPSLGTLTEGHGLLGDAALFESIRCSCCQGKMLSPFL